jgi:hypothetical protein
MSPPAALDALLASLVDAAGAAGDVPDRAIKRHLGLPRAAPIDEPLEARIAAAREWYRAHGGPWAHAARREIRGLENGAVVLEGDVRLESPLLAAGFRESGARAIVVLGASAGGAVDDAIAARWHDGAPDEAMVLHAFAAALVERVRWRFGVRLGALLGGGGDVMLPHYSPGYEGWSLEGQAAALAALGEPGPLRLLDSGGLQPARSTLAVFGVASRSIASGALAGFWFRARSLYDGGRSEAAAPPRPAGYGFPERALEKWTRERLTVSRPDLGRIDAAFRFDGKTCTNLGRALAIDYRVALRTAAGAAARIEALRCAPAAGDAGHRATCAFIADPEGFPALLAETPPLIGASLDDALAWSPDSSPSGCLCQPSSRSHKWRLVLHTLHFALARAEDSPPAKGAST